MESFVYLLSFSGYIIDMYAIKPCEVFRVINSKKYGFHRSLIPNNTTLQKAWRVNNSADINEHEILLDVELLNINRVSFIQIYKECSGNRLEIAEKILKTVNERGKMHNPITGTGGMLFGKVEKIGAQFAGDPDITVGDDVVNLVSLASTPLLIEKITDIDMELGQVYIKGKAVLFSSSLLVRQPDKAQLKTMMAIIDIAGAPCETAKIIRPGMRVLIQDPLSHLGVLCSYAARKALGDSGELFALAVEEKNKKCLASWGIFDKQIVANTHDIKKFTGAKETKEDYFDVVINCLNSSISEMISVLLIKNHGQIFFPGLGSDIKNAGLSAESVGKDVTITPYKGYSEGYIKFILDLINEYPEIIKVFNSFAKIDYSFDLLEERESEQSEEYCRDKNNRSLILNKDLTPKNFVCESGKIRRVLESALRVARYDCTVLITGDSGTGKEIIAKVIHDNSERSAFPFIKINCAAIPENLLESELFGYEKGAFTGARNTGKKGLWEFAKDGTIFLDEIGEIPLSLQAKLLRVLQENEFYRIGGSVPIFTNTRIIAATNRDLKSMAEKGNFREDLYYRLSVFPIYIPPLRERREDIPALIKMLTEEYNQKFGLNKKTMIM